MHKKFTLLLFCTFISLLVFPGSPQLVWHQTYGEANLMQQVTVAAIDNYDNMFVAGFVDFGGYGNIIVNRYNAVGDLKWNRMFYNPQSHNANDIPVALFPDNQAGVTVVGYLFGRAVVTHIFSYNPNGNISSDVTVGDTSAGSRTYPFAVLYDGANAYYMLGQLNNVSKVFKCDNSGNVIWSTPLHNAYNNQLGSISFDPLGNLVVGVSDSTVLQVMVRRYDRNTGSELPGFNTHVINLPVNDNFIRTTVDANGNIFLAATGLDTASRTQWLVNKYDTTGALLWSTMCNSSKGHSNIINTFMLDHFGDVIISGPQTDNADAEQYAAVYKISGDTGAVLWTRIDSLFLVNQAVTQIDLYSNVYLSTTKTPSTISPIYSQFSCSQLTPDSGIVQWNRSFDNSADNVGLITQVNNFGDIFLANTSPTDSGSEWFVGRIGNAAGDNAGTGIKNVEDDLGSLNVFPNPFSSCTHLCFTATTHEKLWLKLFDINGRVIQEQPVQTTVGANMVTVNTNLTAGVYLLKLEGSNSSTGKPVVVY